MHDWCNKYAIDLRMHMAKKKNKKQRNREHRHSKRYRTQQKQCGVRGWDMGDSRYTFTFKREQSQITNLISYLKELEK